MSKPEDKKKVITTYKCITIMKFKFDHIGIKYCAVLSKLFYFQQKLKGIHFLLLFIHIIIYRIKQYEDHILRLTNRLALKIETFNEAFILLLHSLTL